MKLLEIKKDNILIRVYNKRPRNLIAPKQVHSDKVIFLENSTNLEGDAILTAKKNIPIGIKTADCVPILVWNKDIIGAIHAGWRGLSLGIIQKTIKNIRDISKSKIKAYVGPSAKECCYEVGKEFKHLFLDIKALNEKFYFDTQKEAIRQLYDEGLKDIIIDSRCTICSNELYSYRRDKTDKRMFFTIKLLK